MSTAGITKEEGNEGIQVKSEPLDTCATAITTAEEQQPLGLNSPVAHISNKQQLCSEASGSSSKRHLRIRYWSSYEELKLVELWYLHSAEIVTLQENLPIFRRIADSMKSQSFMVTPQDCRRKLNALKNIYIAERRKLEGDCMKTSEWRLYNMVHAILSQNEVDNDLQHELRIVNRLLSKIAPSTCSTQQVPVKTHIQTPPQQHLQLQPLHQPPQRLPQPTQQVQQEPAPQQKMPSQNKVSNPYKRVYNSRISPKPSQPPECQASQPAIANSSAPSPPTIKMPIENGLNFLLKLKHNFVEPTIIDELRVDNRRLAQERDTALERLNEAEMQLQAWQQQLSHWHEQQEQVLQRLRCDAGGEN